MPKGSRNPVVSKRNAELGARELADMKAEGLLRSPEGLASRVEARKNHPLRGYFEWDSKRGAHLNRVRQARDLIQAATEVRVLPRTKRRPKSHFSVKVAATNGRRLREYATRREVISSEDHLNQISSDCYKRIAAECRNIEDLGLDELDPRWKAICGIVKRNPPSASLLG